MVGSERLFHFCKSVASAVQGHPRSLMLVLIESAYVTSYYFGSVNFRCTRSSMLGSASV